MGKHTYAYILINEMYNRDVILGNKVTSQYASLLQNKRKTPPKLVMYIFTIGHWIFHHCQNLQGCDILKEQNAGSVTVAEGL